MHSERLSVGQACQLSVDASRRETPLPLALVAGDRYRIELAAGQQWNDWRRPAVDPLDGDSGEDSLLMRLAARLKRIATESYMTLGVAMRSAGTCQKQRVDRRGLVLTLPDAGELAFFANDIPLLHGNNGGSVWVTVQRLAAP